MSENMLWEERKELLRLILPAYFERIKARGINPLIESGIGSLLDPRKAVRDFIDKDLHLDPREFRDWVESEWWRFFHLRVHNPGDEKGFAQTLVAYLDPVEPAETSS